MKKTWPILICYPSIPCRDRIHKYPNKGILYPSQYSEQEYPEYKTKRHHLRKMEQLNARVITQAQEFPFFQQSQLYFVMKLEGSKLSGTVVLIYRSALH
jgi:hypothetical protein